MKTRVFLTVLAFSMLIGVIIAGLPPVTAQDKTPGAIICLGWGDKCTQLVTVTPVPTAIPPCPPCPPGWPLPPEKCHVAEW